MADAITSDSSPPSKRVTIATRPRAELGASISTVQTHNSATSGPIQEHAVSPASVQALIDQLHAQTALASTLEFYAHASATTGRAVVMDARYGGLPVIIGRDNRPIALYDFLEALDGLTDYGGLQAEFPTLSLGQIAGALSFVRRLAQFNLRGVDIDRLEIDIVESSPAFRAEMERALADREVTRVLTRE